MDERSRTQQAWDLAESQLWLTTFAQLIGLGFSRHEIGARIGSKRLWRVYPGVYAVGHPGMDPRRERRAAVLACGEGAGLSDMSGLLQWRVWEGPEPERHHVSIPTRNGRTGASKARTEEEAESLADRIQIHRPRSLEIETFEEVPVTTLRQAILDVSATLNPWQLRQVLRQAERVHGFDLSALKAAVDGKPAGNWRAQRVKKALAYVLDDSGMTQTEREALYLDICRRYRVPQPEPQRKFGTKRADFAHERLKLIIEIDDRGSHGGHVAFLEDRRRDRENANRGYETVRFTVAECRQEPKLVAADSLAAIARRVELLGLDPREWGLGPNRART